MSTQTRTFGESIRAYREKLGLTISFVATKLNVDQSLLSKFERNERVPTKEIITDIAEFYSIDEDILTDELLSDQIAYKIIGNEKGLHVLKIVEKKLKHQYKVKSK